jgi:hypothetical protein
MELEELRPEDKYSVRPGECEGLKKSKVNRASLQMESPSVSITGGAHGMKFRIQSIGAGV